MVLGFSRVINAINVTPRSEIRAPPSKDINGSEQIELDQPSRSLFSMAELSKDVLMRRTTRADSCLLVNSEPFPISREQKRKVPHRFF